VDGQLKGVQDVASLRKAGLLGLWIYSLPMLYQATAPPPPPHPYIHTPIGVVPASEACVLLGDLQATSLWRDS